MPNYPSIGSARYTPRKKIHGKISCYANIIYVRSSLIERIKLLNYKAYAWRVESYRESCGCFRY